MKTARIACEDAKRELREFVLDKLPTDKQDRIRRHVLDCDDCNQACVELLEKSVESGDVHLPAAPSLSSVPTPIMTQIFEAARDYLAKGDLDAMNRCLDRIVRMTAAQLQAQVLYVLLRSALESGIALRFRRRNVEPSVFGNWTWRWRPAGPYLESDAGLRTESKDVEFEGIFPKYQVRIVTARRNGHCDLSATLSPEPQGAFDLVLHSLEDGNRSYGRRMNFREYVFEEIAAGMYVLEVQALRPDGEYDSVVQVTIQIDKE